MSNKEIPYKIYLEESEMPKQWYNVRADMKKKPAPLLNPVMPPKYFALLFKFMFMLVPKSPIETEFVYSFFIIPWF